VNERVKYPIVITVICAVAAAALAATFALTRDEIAKSQRQDFENGLKVVLPEGEVKLFDADRTVYAAYQGGRITGYAGPGEAQGYSSRIRLLVGLQPDLQRIVAVRILDQQETPGLGERTREVPPTKTIWQAIGGLFGGGGDAEPKREAPFQSQFRGKTPGELRLTSDANDPAAIHQLTGATISSQAVVDAVKVGIEKIKAAVAEADKKAEE
jgi:Na+-translocating ferredoxin:NAD+ oxidoreductase subunit G